MFRLEILISEQVTAKQKAHQLSDVLLSHTLKLLIGDAVVVRIYLLRSDKIIHNTLSVRPQTPRQRFIDGQFWCHYIYRSTSFLTMHFGISIIRHADL